MIMQRVLPRDIWQEESFGLRLSIKARYLFLGIVFNADETGEFPYLLPDIKRILFPHDDIDYEEIDNLIKQVCDSGLIEDWGESIRVKDWYKYLLNFDPDELNEWLVLRRSVFHRDRYSCVYCGDVAQEADHIIPKSKGGQDLANNLVAACRKCNQSKLASDMLTWYKNQPFFRVTRLAYILNITKST